MRSWKNYNQVFVTRVSGEKVKVFECGTALGALDYAMNKVARNERVFDRIEVRSAWGTEPLHTVWLSPRTVEEINKRLIAHMVVAL